MAREKALTPNQRGFHIRFFGEGVSPSNVRLSELADILTSVEQALAAIMGSPAEEVVLGLVQVKPGSVDYAIAAPSNAAVEAFRIWGDALERSDFTAVPPRAYEPSRKVVAFVKRRNCVGELTELRGRRPIAHITPDTAIKARIIESLIGQTVIYGYALRVGGREPRLLLRLSDTETIALDVANEALARQIGNRLYTWIGLGGTARWHPETRATLSFRAEELLPYEGKPASMALADLSALVGDDFADMTDVEGEMGRIRSMPDLADADA